MSQKSQESLLAGVSQRLQTNFKSQLNHTQKIVGEPNSHSWPRTPTLMDVRPRDRVFESVLKLVLKTKRRKSQVRGVAHDDTSGLVFAVVGTTEREAGLSC